MAAVRRTRKPLIGAASLAAALLLAYAAARLAGATEGAALAAIPTLVAPLYYGWKRRIYAAAAAGVLSSMASGAIAWVASMAAGAGAPEPSYSVPLFAAGFATAGAASHVGASILWAAGIHSVYSGDLEMLAWIAGGLACGLATGVGSVVAASLANGTSPRPSPGLAAVTAAALGFLALYEALQPGPLF